ncbi:MAG: DMT family transporter [Pseudomonadota bacterium]
MRRFIETDSFPLLFIPMPRTLIAIPLGLMGVIIFGATLPMTRLAVQELDWAFLTAGRAVIAGLIALSILIAFRRSFPWPDIRILSAIGLMLVFGWPVLTAIAMQTVPASHGGIITGILPLATVAASVFVNGERPSPLFWLFSVMGAGVVILFAIEDGTGGFVIGDVLLLFGVAAAGIGYALSGRMSAKLPGWEVICWALVLTLPVSVVWLLFTLGDVNWNASAAAWSGFAYVSTMSQLFGFFFWNKALAMGGTARIGQLMLFITFVTIIISAVILRETIAPDMWGYAAVVAILVGLGQRARITQKQSHTAQEN